MRFFIWLPSSTVKLSRHAAYQSVGRSVGPALISQAGGEEELPVFSVSLA